MKDTNINDKSAASEYAIGQLTQEAFASFEIPTVAEPVEQPTQVIDLSQESFLSQTSFLQASQHNNHQNEPTGEHHQSHFLYPRPFSFNPSHGMYSTSYSHPTQTLTPSDIHRPIYASQYRHSLYL